MLDQQPRRVPGRHCAPLHRLLHRMGKIDLRCLAAFTAGARQLSVPARIFEAQRVVAGTLGEPPTRSRQVKTLPPHSDFRLILREFAGQRYFRYTVYYAESLGLGAVDGPIELVVEQLRCHPSLLVHYMRIDICVTLVPEARAVRSRSSVGRRRRTPAKRTRGVDHGTVLRWEAELWAASVRRSQLALTTAGGVQLPSRIEGLFSFGQYMRIIAMKSPFGAGSQLDSLSAPGDAFWK